MPAEYKPCPNQELNESGCTCPKTDCANHGICCRCVANHQKLGNLPRCLRKPGE